MHPCLGVGGRSGMVEQVNQKRNDCARMENLDGRISSGPTEKAKRLRIYGKHGAAIGSLRLFARVDAWSEFDFVSGWKTSERRKLTIFQVLIYAWSDCKYEFIVKPIIPKHSSRNCMAIKLKSYKIGLLFWKTLLIYSDQNLEKTDFHAFDRTLHRLSQKEPVGHRGCKSQS